MTSHGRRVVLLLLAAALPLIVAACAPGDPPDLPVPSGAAVTDAGCAPAGQALVDGRLADAEKAYLALMASSRPACAREGVFAVRERRAEAAGAVAAGDDAYATGRYAAARRWYRQAQRIDLDNTAATDGLTAVQRRTRGEDRPGTGWADPLGRLVLPFLGALVAMLLIARVLTRPSLPLPKDPARRVLLLAAGVACGLAGAAGIAATVAGYAAGLLVPAVSVLLGVVAAVVLALWLGMRLGARVEVRAADDKGDAQATAFLVGRLAALGAEPPRGLHIPRGTDVATLPESAFAAMPQGAVLQALLKAGWAVLRLSPWRLVVTLGEWDNATVEISRNGRPVSTEVVWRRDLVPPDAPADGAKDAVLTGAAALFLITLSRSHTTLAKGLCGTTNWRSLTRQVLAGETQDPGLRTRLLADAIDADPANGLAWYAYLLALAGGEPARVGGWRGVACRLDALYERLQSRRATGAPACPDDGYAALRIRVLYSSAVGWLRHWEDDKRTDPERAAALAHAAASVEAMNRAVTAALGMPTVKDFAAEAQPLAAALAATVTAAGGGKEPAGPWLEPGDRYLTELVLSSLRALYAIACREARTKDGATRALAALGLAAGRPEQRAGAGSDPALRGLLSGGPFRQLVTGQPGISELAPIVSYAAPLAEQRIFVPGDLLARPPATDAALATALGVPVAEVTRWRDLCLVAVTCPDPRHAATWTNLLHGLGIGSLGTLRALLGTPGARRGTVPLLAAVSAGAQTPPPDGKTLESWAAPATA
ncbi:hypothetical protein Asp14428_03040 [Actinoplanes sp. NBRC 14428]|nr:hypothetical protein Asp14428_03040 [Actinoplanes sp. NBRC 14428]